MKINIWETLGIDSDKAKNAVNVKTTIEGDVKSETPAEQPTSDVQLVHEDQDELESLPDTEESTEPENSAEPEEPESPESSAEPESPDDVAVDASVDQAIETETGAEPENAKSVEKGKDAEETKAEENIEEMETAEETKAAENIEDVETVEEIQKPKLNEKLLAFGKAYGWIAGIAAAFAVLIGFMIVYTTMTPREVHATIDGETRSFTSEEHTIEGLLQEESIALCEEDYISVPTEAFIYDGMKFELDHATDFKVTADGETKAYKSLDDTVAAALDDVGIKVGEIDIVTPDPDSSLAQNMSVVVQRVVIERETVEEDVAFKTVEKEDDTMNEGESKIVKAGKKGKDKVTYEIKYIDGKEASRKEIHREVVAKPKKQVVANGTRVVYNGKSYSRKLVVKAYAYTGGGTTAMGTRARVGEIAVDPSVIPLGTNVYIEGVGERRAEDTGGNIKGNTIDIYMSSQAACLRWGVRYVTIYIE